MIETSEDLNQAPWTVEEFIASAERIISSAPELFAHEDADTKRDLNVRLIRDYVVREFIPRPVRSGREARFGLNHLVHLLSVRALLRSQKWSLPAIKASFVTTSTEDLLNGVLAQVRTRIEGEYHRARKLAKAGASEESLRTPILNPAQQLIEKFKATKKSQSKGIDPQLHRSTAMAFADLSIASASDQRSSRRNMLHIQLEPWCEVVIDAQRLALLTPKEIERLGEILKRRLQSEMES
jgi:hypothetical protein